MSRRFIALGAALAAGLSLLTVLATPANATETTGRGLLAKLTVASEAGTTQYSEARFKPWGDLDGDCLSTRQEVFIQDSTAPVSFETTCRVGRGKFTGYWPGEASWSDTTYLKVDHRVALKEAWQSGAYWWSPATRERYANDLGYTHTLVVTSKSLDVEKGDSDPAEWLPSEHPYTQCNYALAWIQVKYRWKLTVDPTEKAALLDILQGACRERTIVIPPRAI
jgi:hypothetical protein